MRRCLAPLAAAWCLAALVPAGHAADEATPLDLLQVMQRQAEISSSLAEIARKMDAENPAEQRLRAVLHALASTESARALEAMQTLARSTDPAERERAAVLLRSSQDRIIEIIEKILGIVTSLKTAAEPLKEERGSDLSDLEKEKFRELADKLKEFLEQQKKVVDGTTSLAKLPVDDFTPQEEEQLKQLAAAEDQLSRFLKDTHSDLSKMAEQDFSNPALLRELVEIYTEVEMARDALQKKTVELAVPHEEAGVELAENMLSNIERWLMDTPDRIRWQMEEPLADYEIPMAELPEQLQDIVGQLMEQEEDLMEDIEDATSGWADSIDKGAGWTAMDGPISNWSARGVTGNMLPNTSEISGRSGEGRTGKSAGEFVEDTAVGKGGRRTPTRLTPDAFQKGVVDDRSPEPAGGATGGGKISGAGAEGLEGPVPQQLQQRLRALAGRQAELRNKAERVEVMFRNFSYPTEPISQTVRRMKDMEAALARGDVAQIARTRNVLLRDIQDAHAFLAGEVRINRDRSVGLPPELQEEIMDAAGEPSPGAYDDLLRAYFQVLAQPR